MKRAVPTALLILAAALLIGCGDGYPDWERRPAPSEAELRCLAQSPADADLLYLGTLGDGLYRSEDGGSAWVRVPGGEGLAIHRLLFHDGALYAATDRGLWLGDDDEAGLVHERLENPLWSLAYDETDGLLLLGGVGVVHAYDPATGAAEEIVITGLPEDTAITALAARPEALLAGTLGAGLYRLERGVTPATEETEAIPPRWRAVSGSLTDPFEARRVTLLEEHDGALYVGSVYDGCYRSVDGSTFEKRRGLPPEFKYVADLLFTTERIYLATAGIRTDGLYYSPAGDGLVWTLWPDSPHSVRGLAETADGRILAVTETDGLYLADPSGQTTAPEPTDR